MAVFQWLDQWLASDPTNFNLFIMISTIIALSSVIVLTVMIKKIGIEHLHIKLKIDRAMFVSLLILITGFVLFVPVEMIFYKQYVGSMVVISILVGAVVSSYFYLKQKTV
ncbi:hypothetical protein PQ478_02245 [Alkalihalophilus pseudofirmus]|uniref:hypothetical protein n=1 Tax=Alkalihalophilus pseudofirmus TaxID=79885 RepID=UPI00259BE7D0|nr:hypothetical protein [Alkalihalophilus pseudofirmus]WEG17345.1 hypothetical protein PQ478_02245 [Alkalihalophilus pseudofirmus]